MSAREEILSRVRANLEGARAEIVERTPVAVPTLPADVDGRVGIFTAVLEGVGGTVHRVRDSEEAFAAVAAIAAREGATRIACSDAPLAQRAVHALSGVTVLDADSTREAWLDAEVGVTSAQLAIAETGTLVLASDDERSRLASLLPGVHVALLQADAIVRTLDDALTSLARPEPGAQSRAITFITGPSRTADIELTLVVGVHGPRALDVLVIG